MPKRKHQRSTEQAILDLINFCNQNSRYPNQNSDDPYEKSLAVCVANYKRNKATTKVAFSDEQVRIVQELQSTYSTRSPKKTAREKLDLLQNFCMKEGHWPSHNSPHESEQKIYGSCCQQKYYNTPQLLSEYIDLKNKYMSRLLPNEVLEELIQWVRNYKTTPRENSNDEKESKLAKNIKYLKFTKKFSDDELDKITQIYTQSGPRGGTSMFEQILYHYLQSASNNSLVSNRNSDRFEVEVDILIENISKTIAVFFDSSFFHQDKDRDNRINKQLRDQGVVVLRFQEEGCPTLNDCISIPVQKGICYQDFLIEINQYFTSSDCPICDIISTEYIDNEEILSNARTAVSRSSLVRGHLLNYIGTALSTANKPKTTSKIYRNCKTCFQRNQFTDKESLLYAFTKRLYDSSPQKRRNIDVPSITNDDIELLFRIIEFFYKNTPYNHSVFKETLIANINDRLE